MIRGLNHITLATTDLAQSFQFYTEVLGARPLARWRAGAYLLLGELWLCLDVGPQVNASVAYTHIAFDVDADAFDAMARRIRESGATVWKENRSEGLSLYFMDPDNHKLELHVGDWKTRLASMKARPWDPQTEFFPASHG
jgi:catechol 2,3-dioxygenase-like lactoylglutathione lyase family enzyme